MDSLLRYKDDIIYLAREEDLHAALRDTFKKYSPEWIEDQRIFGTYFRARCAVMREAKKAFPSFDIEKFLMDDAEHWNYHRAVIKEFT